MSKYSLVIIFAVCLANGNSRAEDSLKSVQVVFRHGEKTQDTTFGVRSGLLTNEGKLQMYDLGKYIRGRYASFVKDAYDANEFELLSSASNRCVQSGSLFAYGLYEEYNRGANWSQAEAIPYDPIPVQTIPKQFDNLLQMTDDCPQRGKLKAQLTETVSSRFIDQNPDYVQAFLENVGDYSVLNESISATDRTFRMASLLETYSAGGVVPEWAKTYHEREIYQAMKYDYNEMLFGGGTLTQLQAGPFLQLLYNRMKEPSKKMLAYASHDFSVSALLQIFVANRRDYPADPPVSSAFMLEIHRESSESEPFLKVFYREGVSKSVTEMQDIPGCPSPCTLPKLWGILKDKILSNYQDVCRLQNDASSEGLDLIPLVIIVGLVVAGGVIAVVLVSMNRKRKRRYEIL